jgi:hypothetical protein
MKGKSHHAHHAHGGHAHHMVKKHSMHAMKHRSHHAKGGKVHHDEHGVAEWESDKTPSEVYAGAGSNVVKEASHKKRGGKVHHGKHVDMHGHSAHHRLDRPKRKSGGGVGSEMRPFSAAHSVKSPAGRDVDPGES